MVGTSVHATAAPDAVAGEYVRAHATVTFTAPKICHVTAPACNLMGELHVVPIGTPAAMYENDAAITFAQVAPDKGDRAKPLVVKLEACSGPLGLDFAHPITKHAAPPLFLDTGVWQ